MNLKFKFDSEKIKSITEAYAEEILYELDIDPRLIMGHRGPCPIHGGDNPSAFLYTPDNGRWTCFTNGCHSTYGSDIIGLIRGVNNCSFVEACEWVLSLLEGKNMEDLLESSSVKHFIHTRSVPISKYNRELSNSWIDSKSNEVDYFLKRGINQNCLDEFNVFQSFNRAYVPIYDDTDRFVGVTGRDITDLDGVKWMHEPKDFNKSIVLFNLNKAIKNPTESIFIVEGPLDVMFLWQEGIKNVCSILGNSFSPDQRNLLLKYKYKKVLVLMDNDEGGLPQGKRICENLSLYFNTINLTENIKGDPKDCTSKEIEWLKNQI